jgi:Ca2+-transporting ATPase
VESLETPDRTAALRAMVLANDADPGAPSGDPLEHALLAYVTAAGLDVAEVRAAAPRLSSRSFESTARFMRVTVVEEGAVVSYLKGAPEVLLDRSRLSAAERTAWEARAEAAAAGGFRTLGFARVQDEAENDVEWLGVAALWDPPRPEVENALLRAQAAGIRVVMITGDHAATASTVARRLGLTAQPVITGAELAAHAAADVRRLAQSTAVFARMDPEQKLRVVTALQAEGEVVAVTGDGVNDAPALKRADVGIAMGSRGSDVAREVADLVIMDDNFATIVAAVEEGRGIFANIEKFVRFLFATNLAEVLVVAIGALAAFAFDLRDTAGAILLPLTAAQLLWINLLTDGAPALALGLDRNPGVMARPPRPPAAPLLDRRSLHFILGAGFAIAAVTLAWIAVAWSLVRVSAAAAATGAFALVALSQLISVYAARRSGEHPRPNRAIHVAVGAGIAAQLLVLTVQGLARPFDVVPLPGGLVLLLAAGVVSAWLAVELVARVAWRRGNLPGATPEG